MPALTTGRSPGLGPSKGVDIERPFPATPCAGPGILLTAAGKPRRPRGLAPKQAWPRLPSARPYE